MAIRVAFNGFGRIGRMVFRHLIHDRRFEIVRINEIASPKSIAHSMLYDSAHGTFNIPIHIMGNYIDADGTKIEITNAVGDTSLSWENPKVDVVIDCTGRNNDADALWVHIAQGAGTVIVSAPINGVKNIVYGVNENTIAPQDKILSVASCTTNCLAPVAYHLHQLLGIKKGYMTAIHAYTKDQTLLDSFHHNEDLRRGRAAAYNIIPTRTGAAKAIGKIIPDLEGKLDGCSQRVPVLTGSLLQLMVLVEKHVSAEQVNAYMKSKTNEAFSYTEDDIVSSDIINMPYGSLFDATQTHVYPVDEACLVCVAAWYDNEYSYASQLYRTLCHWHALGKATL